MSSPSTQSIPKTRPQRSFFVYPTRIPLPKTTEERCCFAFSPKGCFFSGASTRSSRTLCCTFAASRTVTVSPSKTPTMRPEIPVATTSFFPDVFLSDAPSANWTCAFPPCCQQYREPDAALWRHREPFWVIPWHYPAPRDKTMLTIIVQNNNTLFIAKTSNPLILIFKT